MEAIVASAFGCSLNQPGHTGDPAIEAFRAPPPTHYECHVHEIARTAARGPRRPHASFRSKTARLPDPRSKAPGPGAYEHTTRSGTRSPGCTMRGAPRDQQWGAPQDQQWLYRTLESSRRTADKPTLDLRVDALKASAAEGAQKAERPPHIRSHRGRLYRGATGGGHLSPARPPPPQPAHGAPRAPGAAEHELATSDASGLQLLRVGTKRESKKGPSVIHPEVPSSSFVSESPRNLQLVLASGSPDDVGPGYYDTIVSDICIAGRGATPQSKASFNCKSPRFSDGSSASPDIGPGAYNPQKAENPRAPSRSRVPGFSAGGDRWSPQPRSGSETPGPGRYKPHKRPASSAATAHPGVGFSVKADRFKDLSLFPEDLRSDTVQCWYGRSSPDESEPPTRRTMQGLNEIVREALRRAEASSPGEHDELDKTRPAEFLDPGTPDLTRPARFQPAEEAFLATAPRWARTAEAESPLGPGYYHPQVPGAKRPQAHDFSAGPPRSVSVPLDFEAQANIMSYERPWMHDLLVDGEGI
mmetsp:Transcript_44537/g.78923  ORF Transcript_44537/g.78923 Transcript_44537/m.78923 type:complete len:529 (-) Transcript_44537:59-1645(-)